MRLNRLKIHKLNSESDQVIDGKEIISNMHKYAYLFSIIQFIIPEEIWKQQMPPVAMKQVKNDKLNLRTLKYLHQLG